MINYSFSEEVRTLFRSEKRWFADRRVVSAKGMKFLQSNVFLSGLYFSVSYPHKYSLIHTHAHTRLGGRGGDGASSFSRSRIRSFGPADGGDGGRGGDVIVIAKKNLQV